MKNLGEPMHRERVTLKEKVLQRIVESAVEAVKPSSLFNAQFQVTGNNLTAFGDEFDLSRYANVKCIAIGKCAEAMAYEVEKKLGYDVTGIIATPVERHFDTRKFTFFKTGHPLPDGESVRAGRAVENFVSSARECDLLIFLISGGGSASVFVPVNGVTLEEANQTVKILLANGVPMEKINLLRRHISELGGGKLAALAPNVEKISLIISDVVGNQLSSIASGPTSEDSTTQTDANDFLNEAGFAFDVPRSVFTALHGATQPFAKKEISTNHLKIITSNIEALKAAEKTGKDLGFQSVVFTSFFEMDAGAAGEFVVSIARSIELDGLPVHAPALVIMGGETTVKLSREAVTPSRRDEGVGGRNQHLVLCALRKMAQLKEGGVHLAKTTVFSFGTDGKDGNSDAAGAFASLYSLEQTEAGLNEIDDYILQNDSNSFFKKYGGLITTGNTDTNVMDVMGIIVK
ncbi:MAG: glycerate kinase [Candidatus Kryptoniota bacterium]